MQCVRVSACLAVDVSSHAKVVVAACRRYELWAREDIHTKGNIQWFYFAVRNTRARQRVRFTIVNNNKSDSLFNYGMKPLVCVGCPPPTCASCVGRELLRH